MTEKSNSEHSGLSTVDLFTDGGSQGNGGAAGSACIYRLPDARERRSVLFLGDATNNEAEIVAGLLGLSWMRSMNAKASQESRIEWTCDSEYVLKSATQYIFQWQRNGWRTAAKGEVKNQGLWRAYLELAKGMQIHPVPVRGHTGHPENEACDAAVRFAQSSAAELLSFKPDGLLVDVAGGELGQKWFLLDGREYLRHLRDAQTISQTVEAFVDQLKSCTAPLKISPFLQTPTVEPQSNDSNHAENSIIAKLQEAKDLAVKLKGRSEKAKQLAKAVDDLLRKLGSE